MSVVITEHAGWPERRKGTLIPGLHKIEASSGIVSVVTLDNGELHAVPSRNVFSPDGLAYAEEWAVKTHSTIYDVRVPDALAEEVWAP
jgi:hypothetical protein